MTKHTPMPKWTIGRPSRFYTQSYTPIQENIEGSKMTDVCWVLCCGEYANLIRTAPELLEIAKSVAVLGKCHCHAMKSGYTCYVCRAKEAVRRVEEQS